MNVKGGWKMKQKIMQQLETKLNEIGIKGTGSKDTDFEIKTDFVDATFKGGTKKIEYHAMALVDEEKKAIFFYEMTKDTSSGLSFGSDFESSYQSGVSLSRKIKVTRYGLDGKAVDVEVNLGDISKAFKDTAKEYEYGFKVVLSKGKAMYPDPNKKSFFQSLFKK